MMRQVIHRNPQPPHVRVLLPYRSPLRVLNHFLFPQFSFPPPTTSTVNYEATSPGKRSGFNPAVGWMPIIVLCLYIPTGLYLDQEAQHGASKLSYNQGNKKIDHS